MRDSGREALCEPGLADTSRSEERQDASRLEQARCELEVSLASHEGRALRRHAATRVGPHRRACVSVRAHGRWFPSELLAFLENRGFEVAHRSRRPESEVVAQPVPERMRGAQPLGLPTRAVEREHQLGGESLAQRMIDEECLELTHDLLVMPDAQLGVDARLGRHHAQLVEADRLGLDPLGVGEFRERGAAPFAEPGLDVLEGRVRIGVEQRLPIGKATFEARGVDKIFRDLEHIARRAVPKRCVLASELDEAPKPRHVALERGARGIGRVGPEGRDQPVGRDDRIAMGQQDAEQSARFFPAHW